MVLPTRMPYVTGKTALVTGGARGIGLAICQSLLENGANGIAIVDISEASDNQALSTLKTNFKDKVLYIKADVRNPSDLEDAFEKTVCHFKYLDIVVNNAGISNELKWDAVLDINLGGVMRGTQLAFQKYLPKYKSSEYAVIVNISSISGIDAEPDFLAYTATKHGVVGLGKAMNHEKHFEKYKIGVLTICPGGVDTLMLAANKDKLVTLENIAPPDYIGNSIVDLLNNRKRGIWILENGQAPYEVEFPNRKDMRIVHSS